MVAKKVSVNEKKTETYSNMIISQVCYYVWQMHNLQTIEIPKKPVK